MDLDNIDNVSRMALYMGLEFDHSLPLSLARRLKISNEPDYFQIDHESLYLVTEWMELRRKVYQEFIYSSDYMSYEYLIFLLIGKLYKIGGGNQISYIANMTDNRLLDSAEKTNDVEIIKVVKKLRYYTLPKCTSILSTRNLSAIDIRDDEKKYFLFKSELLKKLSACGFDMRLNDLDIHLTTDNRKTSRAVKIFSDDEMITLGKDVQKVLFGVIILNAKFESYHHYITGAVEKLLKNMYGNVIVEKRFIKGENLSLFDE